VTVPGLQPERTRLAWRRSVLAAGIPALLLVRLALENRIPAAAVAGAVLWLAFALVAQRRIHAMVDPRPETPPPVATWGAAALVVTFGLVCVYSLLH
jgi:uncharacterized membrane protein YidH (DUF202 family)